MIMASVVALLAIMLIAGGTPRQAAELFGGRLDRSRRRALRLTGVVVLAGSFGIALIDDDRARHGIAWIGTLGVESLAVALLLTLRANRAKH